MNNDAPWQLLSDQTSSDLPELEAILLKLRSIEDQTQFFSPTHPLEITAEELGFSTQEKIKAIDKLRLARERKTPIVIFGDYDADGICASSVLWRILHTLGFDVKPFIPDRKLHGYGLNLTSAQEVALELAPELIITVDNGIVAFEAVEWLKQQDIEVIITDHHQLELDKLGKAKKPDALAVLQTDQVCGTAVAWMFAKMVLDGLQPENPELNQQLLNKELDLCALATIADQVPLVGANRSFALHGLRLLKQAQRVGLKALLDQAGMKSDQLDEIKISYSLVPRINALGRLAQGIVGVRLLCTSNRTKATSIASELNSLNLTRQDLTTTALNEAEAQVSYQADQKLLIAYSSEFHEGVIGLVAGRLSEKYHKPSIVMGGADEVIKASARSVEGVNITKLIREVKSDLIDVGGHPLAAGFSLNRNKLELVRQKLQIIAQEQIDPKLLILKLQAECILPKDLLTLETVSVVQKFAPFGQANPEPVFVINNLEVVSTKVIGHEGTHLKLLLKPSGGQQPQLLTALYWRHAHLQPDLPPGTTVDVLCRLQVNTWRDKQSLQLDVIDLTLVIS